MKPSLVRVRTAQVGGAGDLHVSASPDALCARADRWARSVCQARPGASLSEPPSERPVTIEVLVELAALMTALNTNEVGQVKGC